MTNQDERPGMAPGAVATAGVEAMQTGDPSDDDSARTTPIAADREVLRQRLPPRAGLLFYYRDTDGRDTNTVVTLSPQERAVVGRSAPADIVIDHTSVSRSHARFTFDGEVVSLEDLNSTNGTLVNGARTAGVVAVRPGDDVAVGSVIVSVQQVTRGERRPEGLESHERLQEALHLEIPRARHFNRSTALLMVTARTEGTHVGSFAPDVQKRLAAVDRAAMYSPAVLEVMLPERTVDDARALADEIVAGRKDLVVGIAAFPELAAGADELLSATFKALGLAKEKGGVCTLERGPAHVIKRAADTAPVVKSPAMKELFGKVDKLARSHIPVVVRGATGTGKEVVAQALHSRGPRAKQPLIAVNCGGLPPTLVEATLFGYMKGAFTGAFKDTKGVFEDGDGGTVFLDEIGELPAAAQAALLRVLETGSVKRIGATREVPVDVRVVSATHRDLDEMCAEGGFRTDLMYRLNGITLMVPLLSERREEILDLARRFVANSRDGGNIAGLDAEAEAALLAHDWPGNVRELRNVMERAVALAEGPRITRADLHEIVRKAPAPARTSPPVTASSVAVDAGGGSLKQRMRAVEAQMIIEALERNDGVQTAAARDLGMPIRTLVYKIKELGIRRVPTTWRVGDKGAGGAQKGSRWTFDAQAGSKGSEDPNATRNDDDGDPAA